MRSRQHTTTIADAWDEEHEYTTVSFGFDEGTQIGLIVSGIVSGPLGAAIDSASVNADDLLASNLDLSKLGNAVADLPQRILQAGGIDLIRRILKTTRRARRDENGTIQWDALSNVGLLDTVYAENYGEALKALWWVLQVNYAPLSGGTTSGWQRLLGIASGWLAARSAATASDTS